MNWAICGSNWWGLTISTTGGTSHAPARGSTLRGLGSCEILELLELNGGSSRENSGTQWFLWLPEARDLVEWSCFWFETTTELWTGDFKNLTWVICTTQRIRRFMLASNTGDQVAHRNGDGTHHNNGVWFFWAMPLSISRKIWHWWNKSLMNYSRNYLTSSIDSHTLLLSHTVTIWYYIYKI